MSHYRNWSKVKFTPDFKDGEGMRRWGGGDQPSYNPPPAPTAVQSAQDYAAAMPSIYATQLEYQPKFAMMSDAINKQLNPITAGLQENLAGQSLDMISQGAPQRLQDEWASNMRAQLGSNVSSPIGADAYSTGLMNYQEQYRNQGRNMALALAGRQQLVQAPTITEAMGGYSPQSVMNYNQQGYGTNMSGLNYAAGLAANNYQAQQQAQNSLYGGLASGLGSIGGGMIAMSSQRYKKNIKLWA
jgi:hypothetical protein